MKITYRTHAPLKWAFDGKVPDIINIERTDHAFFDNNLWVLDEAYALFEREQVALSKKANFIKEPFYEAVIASESRLFGVYEESIRQGVSINIQETYIYRQYVAFFHSNPQSESDKICEYLLIFHRDGAPMLLYNARQPNYLWISGLWIPYDTQDRNKECMKILMSAARNFIDFEIFKKFADVETVFVSGNSRGVFETEKVLNETGVPVLILDSKWFRSIVRSEGFAVRGHFRLQPKKVNGEWTKELIWINDFEKHGYTSKARILNQED